MASLTSLHIQPHLCAVARKLHNAKALICRYICNLPSAWPSENSPITGPILGEPSRIVKPFLQLFFICQRQETLKLYFAPKDILRPHAATEFWPPPLREVEA